MVAGCTINDYPRLAYRGMALDVSRHLFPVIFIKKHIDLLLRYKFDIFPATGRCRTKRHLSLAASATNWIWSRANWRPGRQELTILSTIFTNVGSFNKIKRVIKVPGILNCVAGFENTPISLMVAVNYLQLYGAQKTAFG